MVRPLRAQLCKGGSPVAPVLISFEPHAPEGLTTHTGFAQFILLDLLSSLGYWLRTARMGPPKLGTIAVEQEHGPPVICLCSQLGYTMCIHFDDNLFH